MRCTTTTEQREWLAKNGQIEAPYADAHSAGKFYRQFYTPLRLSQIEAFVACYVVGWQSGEALLVITDWPLYKPYEMKIIDFARSAHGEKRPLTDAAGHIFSLDEKHDLIALFSLTVAYDWKAYLYFPSSKTTLYNWEGEIFDFWTDDKSRYNKLLELQKAFYLNNTGALSSKVYWMGKKVLWLINRLVRS